LIWKFDANGRCVDMPNEAPDCPLKNKVQLRAYPCREPNGVAWASMGPRTEPPPLPDFEWNRHPDNIPFMWRNCRACNWVQTMEGDIDSSHINFLHRSLDGDDLSTVPGVPLPGWCCRRTRTGWKRRVPAARPGTRLRVMETSER
jgi:phenylpropionate dioxygenase-like ring-hydroxylating dioxygenase large terminal subunit